jgi:hypothetical protein
VRLRSGESKSRRTDKADAEARLAKGSSVKRLIQWINRSEERAGRAAIERSSGPIEGGKRAAAQSRPSMRFVPVKSADRQALLMTHVAPKLRLWRNARAFLVRQQTRER